MTPASDQPSVKDWTRGHPQICYQACGSCRAKWYFARSFCPACGDSSPVTHKAAGSGTVYAVTVVHRPPSSALSAHVPYTLLLVDADEGFRLMAHGEPGLSIGDAVQATFRQFGNGLIPHFMKAAPHHG